MTQVVLLEKIGKLGTIGDVVTVKPGFARNYLIPQNKALRATKANLEVFEAQKAQLEADNAKKRDEAAALAKKLDGKSFIVIRQAGEGGQLYGSVSARDLAEVISENGFVISRHNVVMSQVVKSVGLYSFAINLHPEVVANITINVARSIDEAANQVKAEKDAAVEAQKQADAEAKALAEIQARAANANAAAEAEAAESETADKAEAEQEQAS